ncbi:hypothetical protein [Klebsiella phage pKV-BS375-3.1]|nr:hypothetical protein [Klebsiella phage pKV-BS375-3.1]
MRCRNSEISTSTKSWIQNTYSRKPRAAFGSPFLVLGLVQRVRQINCGEYRTNPSEKEIIGIPRYSQVCPR